MKRKVEISIEKARELYGKSQLLDGLLIETFTHEELTKKELPKTWKELDNISGYSVDDLSLIDYSEGGTTDANKNIWPTKELAEASLAMSQLAQLRKVYRDGWEPDWEDYGPKYCITLYKNKIVREGVYTLPRFLSFQTAGIRDEFYDNFRDLVEKAKPLL